MMMVQKHSKQTRTWIRKEEFLQYNSALMEPWDGPASIAFMMAIALEQSSIEMA